MNAPAPGRRFYTPAEVGNRFKVDVKTVARWAKSGKIPPAAIIRTLGGHRRIDADFIDSILRGQS